MDENKALCEATKEFWKYYLIRPTEENFHKIFTRFSDNLVLIGTGKHELYENRPRAEKALEENLVVASGIKFEILDEWYKCTELTDDVRVVYGGLWARQRTDDSSSVLVDMDTRFTAVYVREKNGWKIAHIHHSIPFADQFEGEYYPGTIARKAEAAMELVRHFKMKAESDLMTSVYNHEAFRTYVEKKLAKDSHGMFLLFDLDFFKQCNDCFGHQAGDMLLKKFAELLGEYFSEKAIVGRTGGDEFGVYLSGGYDSEVIRAEMVRLNETFSDESVKTLNKAFSFSVGISLTKKGQSFSEVFSSADKALYAAKNSGRNTCKFADVK